MTNGSSIAPQTHAPARGHEGHPNTADYAPLVHHGQTKAAWVGSIGATIGFVIATVGFLMPGINWLVIGLGFVVVAISAILGGVMRQMGMGAKE